MASRPTKRSRRPRTAVRKYTDDAFEAAGLSPEVSESEQTVPEKHKSGRAEDEDFVMGEDKEREVSDEEDEADFDEAESAVGSTLDKIEQADQKRLAQVDSNMTHSRGLLKPANHTAKLTQLKLTFGTSVQDLLPIIWTRDHWAYGRDATFPSAESFQAAQNGITYGIGGSFCYDSAKLAMEAGKGWDWYYSPVGDKLLKSQHLEIINAEARGKYLPRNRGEKHTILVGPPGKQKEFRLGNSEFFDFGAAWEAPKPKEAKRGRHKKADKQFQDAENDPADHSDTAPEVERIREGWLLNLGNKVQCAAWAPNCTGTTQYLAVVVPLSESQKTAECDLKYTGAPAFTPSPPYPAAIQIWSFEAQEGESSPRPLNMALKPRLRLVLCTEYGDLKRLSWCPMPRKARPLNMENKGPLNLGLLAGIWGDGTVKVLDVNVEENSEETQWLKVQSPMFQAKPPSTLCTCLAWLSPSDLAVGCANGFIAVWSLPASCARPQSSPIPYIYTPIYNTYILNIHSAYPTYPYLLASSCIDGQSKLSSLADPQVDTAEALRTRMGTPNLSYSPFFQTFVTTDEADYVRMHPVRRFFAPVLTLRSTSNVTSVAPCSPCHPTILVGSAGGVAMASNPLQRLLNSKNKHFQQTWFSHEWVHRKNDGNGERIGVSRFYEGFKAEIPNLLRSAPQGKISSNVMTIYEEETAVTVLAFNPNESCAGWTCAGLGCGLLRVEDLTLRKRC
ncbi:predicted protein [Uncinocarpus reesii 1704]|uniref:Transcription factor TFIIIC complex subunit Tfc6 n=1 Tax=Uncinocarpus reesii (strain UAMH 1704) TaxID=336963 RepID=C4JYW8_UNCRE|nr:uncharacterized protein UREG_07369 [Uncinocarpus reesii 1704]EEP82504.1 predicted protein [Uncinocarpus reesii 1704]